MQQFEEMLRKNLFPTFPHSGKIPFDYQRASNPLSPENRIRGGGGGLSPALQGFHKTTAARPGCRQHS